MIELPLEPGLVLRQLEPQDAEALFRLIDRNRESLSHWFPWVEWTESPVDSSVFIQESLEQFARDSSFQLGIWVGENLTGVIGLQSISQFFRSAELYYWLDEEHRGRGIATKVCRNLCEYLFTDLVLNRVEIRCAGPNLKSRAVPERLGFTLEGTLRQLGYAHDGFVDCLVYGLLRQEWQP